jgi:membrane-bound lytic murein transglycosylase MltF
MAFAQLTYRETHLNCESICSPEIAGFRHLTASAANRIGMPLLTALIKADR